MARVMVRVKVRVKARVRVKVKVKVRVRVKVMVILRPFVSRMWLWEHSTTPSATSIDKS